MDRPASRSLAELYRRHVPDAVRLAYVMTGDRMLAEDLAQDAFVRVAGRFGHVRNAEALPAYLRRTVVNLVKNHYRRRSLEQAHLAAERQMVPRGVPARDVAERSAVRDALLQLPYRQRAALVLRFFEDLSEHQVAELLGCRPGTVKSLVSRGLATIRSSSLLELEHE